MSELLKPIVIGDYFDGGEMGWAWYHPNHSRLALIGDNQLSPKREMLKEFASQFQSRDDKVIYWVTGEESPVPNDEYNVDGIQWIEEFPDPPEEFEDRDIFINNRKFFSSSYMELLSKIKGVDRRQTFPSVSYQQHAEGPLNGYIRAINNIEDVELKEWFTSKIEALKTVTWHETKEEGRKYYVNRSGSIYETALSFLESLWSFWADTAKMDDPQQLVLIVEPPKELLTYELDPIIREITSEALRITRYLTDVLTLSLILSTDTLYPADEHFYRYRVVFQTKDSDIDLWTEENEQALPPLFEAWRNGKTEAGVFEDKLDGSGYVLFFRGKNMRFMDEFEGEIS